MDAIANYLNAASFVQAAVLLIPGFVAWKTVQLRQPQGEQKTRDALVEIVAFGLVNALLWSFLTPLSHWAGWPQSRAQVALLIVEVVPSPIALAIFYAWCIDGAARRGWVLWPHPTAWDWIFRNLARKEPLAMIVTLKDGRKVGGAFINSGFASLYPYSRDLLLGEVWRLGADGRFVERIAGSRGLYVEKSDILTLEMFSYNDVLASTQGKGEENE